MKIRTIVAATTLFWSAAAFSAQCPGEMKKIDEALAKNPKLTEAQMAEVKKHRADGEAQHKAGKHAESVATLEKAKKILNVK